MFKLTALASVAVGVVMCTACGGGGEGTESGGVPGYGNTVASAPESSSQSCSVVLYGDSIMAGQNPAGALAETPVQAIKRMRSGWSVEDRSRAGTSAAQLAALFPNDPRTARVVVLEHGINDLILGMSPVESIRSVVDFAKAEGRAVVVTGLSQQTRVDTPRWLAAADGIAQVAKAAAVTYADWPSVTGNTVDGTHPDQAFSNDLASQLVRALDKACK
ncbi:MAG: hypothetical protein DI563_02100 [Variovorax paradoxus]|uniref:SGNH hydrolase-type esterase domain-containing protein n=1 Tax=Variovorax paradoxus TaxID=34073 RepID=A0A2W5QL23_VARPD|nr:MAG: hypothetical protein DI563_02100 [Variovorax paradoxus]